MAIHEARVTRNGLEMPIHCFISHQFKKERNPNPHYHDYTELLYGNKGVVDVYVGTEKYALQKGDLVIIHPNKAHDVLGTGVPSEYTVVKFLPQVLLSVEQTYRDYLLFLLLFQQCYCDHILFREEELKDFPIEQLMKDMITEWGGQQYGYELAMRSDVTKIFLYILRIWQAEKPNLLPENAKYRDVMETAIRTIREDFIDVSEESVAAACNMSRSYFSRIFKKAMNMSFASYVNSVRLSEAEKFLLTTDKTVTEIAEEVGFATTSHFISRFREQHGETPGQYRDIHLSKTEKTQDGIPVD